ncbi:MAG: hypothetical protein M3354_10910 [Chloroflexota bacterium]|nr:hypothetical protein [Chloroflexota bacterium]
MGHGDDHYRHEPILFGDLPGEDRRGRGSASGNGDDAQDSVFEIPRLDATPSVGG